jgi:general secretion pathway protein M
MNTTQVKAWWKSLSSRDKRMIRVAAALLVFVLLWLLALQPAIRTIRSFESAQRTQETKLQQMLNLQSQAQSMQNLPLVSQAAAVTALEVSIEQTFGNRAEIIFNGNNATVNVRGISPEDLAKWLNNIRTNARTVAIQARLTRTNIGWNGSFQMVLPAQ